MPLLLGLVGVALAAIYFLHRANSTVKAVKELDEDTKGLQRRAKGTFTSIFGTPLSRVRDPRLAAVIMMIQLVRTGTPVTAAEKTRILELMDHPLGIGNVSEMFERAWSYTQPRMPFMNCASEMLPMLKERLGAAERRQLIDMLSSVAGATARRASCRWRRFAGSRTGCSGDAAARRLRESRLGMSVSLSTDSKASAFYTM